MPHVIFPEYRDQFKSTKYPFIDTATLVSIDEDYAIPQDIFCDASLYIPGATPPVYISELVISSAGNYITVSDYSKRYTATGVLEPLASSVELYDSRGNQVGILVATTNLSYFTSVSSGTYTFLPKETSFSPRCIISLQDTGVTSVGVENGEQLEGDVWLCGRDGIILRYVNDAVRVDIVGEPLYKREDPDFIVPEFVRTINGMPANEYGNFNLTTTSVDDVLRISTTADGIKIYAAGV